MSGEAKDPAIKLFGKTIQLPEIPPEVAVVDSNQNHETCPPPSDSIRADKEETEDDKDETSKANPATSKQEDEAQRSSEEDSADPDAASGISESNKTTSVDKENAAQSQNASKSEVEEQSETSNSNSKDKTLKKPDKILPCPRCNSMDTKFCYYNNYNVNQPRHFCKNCQRYWTAGGTMRNVPVGAGRRKNKSSANHYHQHRHITVPEALHGNGVKTNGTVLAFGSSDAPLCESMASVLNLADKTMPRNGFHKPDGVVVQINTCAENRVDPPNGSGPNYPGPPWPYPWNTGQWGPMVQAPPHPYCPPGFAVPFFSAGAAYWGWSVPWVAGPSSPATTSGNGSDPNSPTLGKHSRDEQSGIRRSDEGGEDDGAAKERSGEKCLWIPKTLRIDDPGDAAKSSIWATLGIKNDMAEPASGGGLFKSFRSKGEERSHHSEASPVLQANPAALSRSANFQERS